ncbi:MAG: ectoine hydroxylase-related dioxygenase (phytanoyl-CoA dioxygenase family) [Paracrocinitomix sp.]|jgi:ectoine hydroxylase-related dioxygenase (phytanoyl-CoA dioxygenase family)
MSDALMTPGFGLLPHELNFDEFVSICADPTGGVATPHASELVNGIPVYDGDYLRAARTSNDEEAVKEELATVFGSGAGVIAIRNAWNDRPTVDAMTDVLLAIVDRERAGKADSFDHFAASGANSRAWDTLAKAAKLDPATYVAYYANPILTMVSESWLGPAFQLTAQVNIVHPSGAAQSPHRDYHLGFLSNDEAARYPAHVHRLSQALTLQGAVAHSAMPVEAGPTMLLPGSQRFLAGYLAWRDERFKEHFAAHQVQLELEPGDAVFFNPGLHHAAGENRSTNIDRIGNLLQVSSAFGIPMEAVDWAGIATATYPVLQGLARYHQLTNDHMAVCAAGYAWPSNLDTDPSTAGLAPPSMQAILRQALADGVTVDEFTVAMQALATRRKPY